MLRRPKIFAARCAFVLGLASFALIAQAADPGMLQQSHAWGRFGKGSWRQVRILTESFDENGTLTESSSTDNKTIIEEISPDRVTLRVEVTLEVAGQKFPSQPQVIRQGYAGETVGQTVSFKPLSRQVLVVDGREIPCETEQIEIIGGGRKEVSIISYSPRLTPGILKRQSTLSDAASTRTTQQSVSEVYALDRRLKVLGENKTGFRVRQVQTNDRGTTTTQSVHVLDVPGEVVSHTSEKRDAAGHLVRRSTLELVGYTVVDDESPRDKSSRRQRRHKRGR